jgi:hypothetical protein
VSTRGGLSTGDHDRERPELVAAYHASQPHHQHGIHRYTAASFGLDEHELRDRFSFVGERPR